jgi:hypothetical protein
VTIESGGKMSTKKTVRYRDSSDGKFITKKEAERKNPATWERQHIPTRKK